MFGLLVEICFCKTVCENASNRGRGLYLLDPLESPRQTYSNLLTQWYLAWAAILEKVGESKLFMVNKLSGSEGQRRKWRCVF